MYRHPYRCEGLGNCSKARFKSVIYYHLLRVLYKKRYKNKLLRVDDPIKDDDFIQSGVIFYLSGLNKSSSWLYACLTSLAEAGLVVHRKSPTHDQANDFAITAKGVSCYRCYVYRLTEQRLEDQDDELSVLVESC